MAVELSVVAVQLPVVAIQKSVAAIKKTMVAIDLSVVAVRKNVEVVGFTTKDAGRLKAIRPAIIRLHAFVLCNGYALWAAIVFVLLQFIHQVICFKLFRVFYLMP